MAHLRTVDRRRPRLLHLLLALGLAISLLTGCWSFTKGGMIRVNGGLQSADVIIHRHATRALLVAYDVTKGTDWQKTRAVSDILRTAAGELNGFVRDRWWAATDNSQYSEMSHELRYSRTRSRCLAVRIDAGWGTFGYDWHTHPVGNDGCNWGRNPLA
jgi:hypothetical protein